MIKIYNLSVKSVENKMNNCRCLTVMYSMYRYTTNYKAICNRLLLKRMFPKQNGIISYETIDLAIIIIIIINGNWKDA